MPMTRTEPPKEQYRREVADVFELLNDASTEGERIEILHKYESIPLKQMLQLAYDERFEWLLPDSAPPYEAAEEGRVPSSFHREFQKMGMFVKGHGYENMKQQVRERRFIQLLESIDARDADFICACLAQPTRIGRSLHPGLSVTLVRKAFPDLLPPKKKAGTKREVKRKNAD